MDNNKKSYSVWHLIQDYPLLAFLFGIICVGALTDIVRAIMLCK